MKTRARTFPALMAIAVGASVLVFARGASAQDDKGKKSPVLAVVGDGPGALLRAPELYAWILAALLGTVFQQSAFRASALTASLPAMTVTEPSSS